MDGDGTCDYLDDDTDGDGTDDTADAFPEDACADTDTDGDGLPDTLVSGCTTPSPRTTMTTSMPATSSAYIRAVHRRQRNDGTYSAYIYSQSDGHGDGSLDLLLTMRKDS